MYISGIYITKSPQWQIQDLKKEVSEMVCPQFLNITLIFIGFAGAVMITKPKATFRVDIP